MTYADDEPLDKVNDTAETVDVPVSWFGKVWRWLKGKK
jgi:hypothetical protein